MADKKLRMKNYKKEQLKVRSAARVVIVDEDKIAVLDVKNGKYHKIPGGGIEDNESVEDAVKREAMEEAGCEIEIIDEIGKSEFIDPDDSNLLHKSVCFVGKKIDAHDRQYFTQQELDNKFKLLWVTFEEAFELFENQGDITKFEREMNDRDYKFVQIAKKYLIDNENI